MLRAPDKEPLLFSGASIIFSWNSGVMCDYPALFAMFEESVSDPNCRAKTSLSQPSLQRIGGIALAYHVHAVAERVRPWIPVMMPFSLISQDTFLSKGAPHNEEEVQKMFTSYDFSQDQTSNNKDSWMQRGLENLLSLENESWESFCTVWVQQFQALKPPNAEKRGEDLYFFDQSHRLLAGLCSQARKSISKSGLWGYLYPDESTWDLLRSDVTAEHVSHVRQEREKILTKLAAQEAQAQAASTFGRNICQKDPVAPSKKEKTKTRPECPTSSTDTTEALDALDLDPAAAESATAPKEKIPVSKRAFEMVCCLYPQLAQESGRSFGWGSFVHAMSDLGFEATSCGGSAVNFTLRRAVDGQKEGKRITLHRPHGPSIDSWELQMFAKRMGKHFGWQRELFDLEA